MNPTARPKWLTTAIVLPVLVLLLAVAAQALGKLRETPVTRGKHLASLVPLDLPGWQGREVPLGPNEFVAGEVEKVLNFDDAINREYLRGGKEFAVYVAYWGYGKMPTRMVASHTPDRCWTENGWRCLEMKFKQAGAVDGQALQPAEWRLFEPPGGGKPTYVLFWHLVEGKVYDYGERFNAVPDPFLWWKDAVQQALLGSREQYFIRLTSSAPLETLWTDPGFAEVLRGLKSIGLTQGIGAKGGD
ncbi:MAG: exosortase-associated EpsI family protein [Opitutaceae bacterium]